MIGLFIFLTLGFSTFFLGNKIQKMAKQNESQKWAANLASMLQVGIIGYAVSAAFVELAYFDLYYSLIGLMILTKIVITRENEETQSMHAESRPLQRNNKSL